MSEYGIFTDEGCIEGGFYSEADARAAIAERYSDEPFVEVLAMCPEPDHEDQPAEGCEVCNGEEDDL